MKIGRNDPCRCGSGRKYKKCCLEADESTARAEAAARQVESEAAQSAAEAAAGDAKKPSARPSPVNRKIAPKVSGPAHAPTVHSRKV
jgi:hypothetical protein